MSELSKKETENLNNLYANVRPDEQVLWSGSYIAPLTGSVFFLLFIGLVFTGIGVCALFFAGQWFGLLFMFFGIMLTVTMISNIPKKNRPVSHCILTNERALRYGLDEVESIQYGDIIKIEEEENYRNLHNIIIRSEISTLTLYNIPIGAELDSIKDILTGYSQVKGIGKDYAIGSENEAYKDSLTNDIPEYQWTDNVREALKFINFHTVGRGGRKEETVFAFGEYKGSIKNKERIRTILLGMAVTAPMFIVFLVGVLDGAEVPPEIKIVMAFPLLILVSVILWAVFHTEKYTYVVTPKYLVLFRGKWSGSNSWINLYLNGGAEYDNQTGGVRVYGDCFGYRNQRNQREESEFYLENLPTEEAQRVMEAVDEAERYREREHLGEFSYDRF